jgi:hypothetical protein
MVSPVRMLVGTDVSCSELDADGRDWGSGDGATLVSADEVADECCELSSCMYAMGPHTRQWRRIMCEMRLARSVSLAVSGCR